LSSESDEYKPYVYTPFFRRFTDERARDIAETEALYTSVRARYLSSRYAADDAIRSFVLALAEEPINIDLCVLLDGILRMEDTIFGFDEVNLDHISLKEQVDLNRYLRAKDYFFAHEAQVMESLEKALSLIYSHISSLLPKTLAPSPFVIPLAYALPDPKLLIENLYATLWKQEYVKNGLFVNLTRQLYFNLCAVSGIPNPEDVKKPFLHASKNKEPLSDIIDDYLKDTPFHPFFKEPVPLQLTHEERFSHTQIIGGSGAGKTQLLQNLILYDLKSKNRPALVIVDSQGDLIRKILHLDLDFDPILISPKDINNPPALNIFDVKRLGNYDEASREQVTAGVIQTFDYLFEGLLGADLTAKQGVFFRFVARLMLALPETMGRNATILDMLALMDDVTPYVAAIAKLPPIQRHFFERDFPSKSFAQTKEQIRYRLQAILENPTLARLFSSPETKIDLFTEINKGSVILVDTAKDFLKGASAHFGRIFISLVLQAVLERAVIPENKRTHAFLIVDEAAQYFDSNIDDLLTEARKYKLGCVFAHQFLEQCTPSLRASLAANTAIKMAGGVSTGDARAMAPEMRTTPDFILSQPKLHFACHIRNVTPQAVSIPVNAGELEKHPTLSEEDYDLLIARNRERVSSRLHTNERKSESKFSPDPGTGASSDW
jgi:hypothetical protein